MQSKLTLPALEGHVVITAENVSVMSGDELVIQLSVDEWESLRQDFRLDDDVDYERGETPMTSLQFQSCVEITRKIRSLEADNGQLRKELRE